MTIEIKTFGLWIPLFDMVSILWLLIIDEVEGDTKEAIKDFGKVDITEIESLESEDSNT